MFPFFIVYVFTDRSFVCSLHFWFISLDSVFQVLFHIRPYTIQVYNKILVQGLITRNDLGKTTTSETSVSGTDPTGTSIFSFHEVSTCFLLTSFLVDQSYSYQHGK